MLKPAGKHIAAGTRVRVKDPGAVPHWSEWESDGHRTSSSSKKRLQQLFFKGDRRVSAQVVYIASEAERNRLKRTGRIKLELRDSAGSTVVILACPLNLQAA